MNLDAPHIMIMTGEPSGDFHAGPLIRQLKKLDPGVRISGIGGPVMADHGADLFFHIDRLSAMGLIQVIRQFSAIKAAFSAFRQRLKTDPPDLVVFIDYPGFNLRAAGYLKSKYPQLPALYYIAPKVWAWNRARLKKIRAVIDHVALILPFEPPMYKKMGIPATYVGNPLVDEYPLSFSSEQEPFENKNGPVIGLLPGSRSSEVSSLLPVMLDAGQKLMAHYPGIQFLISAASLSREIQIRQILADHPVRERCRILPGRPLAVFKASAMLIAASGTVTLEAALCQKPTLIIYKVSPLTYALGRRLIRVRFVGLANLIVNRQVMPELLQHEASPEQICIQAQAMLGNLPRAIGSLTQVRQRLGRAGAPKRTAQIAFSLMRNLSAQALTLPFADK